MYLHCQKCGYKIVTDLVAVIVKEILKIYKPKKYQKYWHINPALTLFIPNHFSKIITNPGRNFIPTFFTVYTFHITLYIPSSLTF